MTSRALFLDAVSVERKTRDANSSRAAVQEFALIAASVPCRIVDQTATANVDSPLGKLPDSTALIMFLPEENVKVGDVVTSLGAPTLDRKWRITGLRVIDRHSMQCTGSEVRDQ